VLARVSRGFLLLMFTLAARSTGRDRLAALACQRLSERPSLIWKRRLGLIIALRFYAGCCSAEWQDSLSGGLQKNYLRPLSSASGVCFNSGLLIFWCHQSLVS